MSRHSQKEAGAYYTPDAVASSLLCWAIRKSNDRLLDPSCGDGRFISAHTNSFGIERDGTALRVAVSRAPFATVMQADFFTWAAKTAERFDCAAGNPPFIRYQTFKGDVREQALSLCSAHGVRFSGLTSSWAPFLVATATLLKHGGRMAFVVPAEIGHAPYAAPLMEYLAGNFSLVQIVAVRDKLFPELSEDCWLLYAQGFGGSTKALRFSALEQFSFAVRPPHRYISISVDEWRNIWECRLRPFLLSAAARELYCYAKDHSETQRFGEVATIGIGYVTGANDFFHLRPSIAEQWNIPRQFLHPTVRNGRALPPQRLTLEVVERWRRADDPILLLRLPKTNDFPSPVTRYLNSESGKVAQNAYKCRVRDPWYSVPDVQIPDFFLSYMSGQQASLVRNGAGCTCTNSLHAVRIKKKSAIDHLVRLWNTPFVRLSCEIEGHPLGGGMLKLEPREASKIVLPPTHVIREVGDPIIEDAVLQMKSWRHYGPGKSV
jgi:adenine-specific DNA-methyltransferase